MSHSFHFRVEMQIWEGCDGFAKSVAVNTLVFADEQRDALSPFDLTLKFHIWLLW